MSQGFSFPPPPPPPPRAAASASSIDYGDRGGRHDARGRGRGRGTRSDYGRTSHDSRGNHQGRSQTTYELPDKLPAGAFVNPAFAQKNRLDALPQFGEAQDPVQKTQKRSWATFANTQEHHAPRSRENGWTRGKHDAPHPMKRQVGQTKREEPPSVPMFGGAFSLPAKPVDTTARTAPTSSAVAKALGIVPQVVSMDDSPGASDDEHESDEEAAMASLQDGPLVVEHNGVVTRLQNPKEIKDWIEQRKTQFPSKQRIAQKEVERRARMNERRRIEQETQTAELQARMTFASEKTSNDDAVQDAVIDGTAETRDGDSDSAPEQSTAKATQTLQVSTASTARTEPKGICGIFQTTGKCKFGQRCRYRHVPSNMPKPTPKSGRITLYQRLVEQEKVKEEELTVQAIKYLGNCGFFRAKPDS